MAGQRALGGLTHLGENLSALASLGSTPRLDASCHLDASAVPDAMHPERSVAMPLLGTLPSGSDSPGFDFTQFDLRHFRHKITPLIVG